jgi:hypothetical protein
MAKRNLEAVYPLSPMQKGMLFHSIYAPEENPYFEQLSCTIRGQLDVEAFRQAWLDVIRRQPILRTSFAWKNVEQMLQVVHKDIQLPFQILDWQNYSTEEQKDALEQFLLKDRENPFDLSQVPLIRLVLMKTTPESHFFVWSYHHILLDGWSLPLVMKEFLAYYAGNHSGQPVHLNPVIPYREYINWLQKQDITEAEKFWKQNLSGFDDTTPIIYDRLVDLRNRTTSDYKELQISLSPVKSEKINKFARQSRITLSVIIQAAWAILLSRYSGHKDIVFGLTVSGRTPEIAGIESMIGLMINTLPLRVRTHPDARIRDILADLAVFSHDLRQFEYTPLVQIQEWSELPPGVSLFDSILVYENYPVDQALSASRG